MKIIKTANYKKISGITEPKTIVSPDNLSKDELISAIRLSIVAEQDAIVLYETYANTTEDSKAKEVFQHVADEEKVHVGEFQALLEEIGGKEELDKFEEGKEEAKEHTLNKKD